MTTEERYELIYGNTARVMEPAPEPVKPKAPKKQPKKRTKTRTQHVFDIEWRSKSVYVAVVVLALMCISYVNLSAGNIQLRKDIATLKTELNVAQIENDDLEAEIYNETDYDSIKQTAISKLGMTKPKKSHIIKFSTTDSDYVRQYSSIPD
jgi:cell division protein FtsL